MKLAFATLGCPDWTFEQIINNAHKLGYTGIEVRGINGVMRAEEITEFFPENAESTKKALSEKGLSIIALNTSCSFHNKEVFDSAIIEGRNAIDICERMGIPAIRVFGDKFFDADKTEVINEAAKGMRILCEYAREKKIRVLLEIHGDFNSIEVVQPVVEKLTDCSEFGIIWDIEHSDKIYRDNWIVFYNAFKEQIRHVHIKDYIRADEPPYTLCMVGKGEIPIKEIIYCLKSNGYSGYYSFEWEKKWHPELAEPEEVFPAYIEYMKQF